jgi:hypothetical protein
VLYRDGLAIAALEGGDVRRLAAADLDDDALRALMVRRASARKGEPHLRSALPRKSDSNQKKRVYAASVR